MFAFVCDSRDDLTRVTCVSLRRRDGRAAWAEVLRRVGMQWLNVRQLTFINRTTPFHHDDQSSSVKVDGNPAGIHREIMIDRLNASASFPLDGYLSGRVTQLPTLDTTVAVHKSTYLIELVQLRYHHAFWRERPCHDGVERD